MREEHELWCCEQLKRIRRGIEQLVAMQAGEFVAVPRRLLLDATRPFHTFKVQGDGDFHAVQIDNPTAVDVEVLQGGQQPTAGNSIKRVPPHTSRVLAFPYHELSIGIDPAAVPAGQSVVYVTYYSRPLAPSLAAFVP
jgi:hypothetical protein